MGRSDPAAKNRGSPSGEMELAERLEQLVIEPPAPAANSGRRSSKRQANALPPGVAAAENVPNLFTCAIDVAKLSSIRTIAGSLATSLRSASNSGGASSSGGLGGLGGGGSAKLTFKPKRYTFHAERPNWKSDIRWVSADDAHTFALFQSLFDKLGIAAAFAPVLGGRIVLFSGFLVIRQNTRKSTFHTDFNGTNGKAFTLMTPLQDMSDLSECHLLAKLPHTAAHRPHTCVQSRAAAVADEWKGSNDQRKTRTASEQEKDGGGKIVNEEEEGGESKDGDRNCDDGANKKCEDRETETETETETATATETEERASELRQYRYREGRGICFGDGFMHATQTGHAPRPLAFLCFTFGVGALTDAEWKGAESYISHQGPIYQDPGGKLVQSAEFPA